MSRRRAIIIGAGPAGLTAAYELLRHTDIEPIVLEKSDHVGGLATTLNFKGNRLDIGPHRFFSKSNRVMQWWFEMLPLQRTDQNQQVSYQGKSLALPSSPNGPDPEHTDKVMLLVDRQTRIYWQRQFFDYPLRLSFDTLTKLGWLRVIKIGFSYLRSALFPITPEENLEHFFINRFGRELYHTFFKSYTEKVWGVSCRQISAAWGAQRIKGVSVWTAVLDFIGKSFAGRFMRTARKTETSLIGQFLYPKYGAGQMWEEVARRVRADGGTIETGWVVDRLIVSGTRVTAVETYHRETAERRTIAVDFVFSTMPVRELVSSLSVSVPATLREVSEGLQYRDFIMVGLLLRRLAVTEADGSALKDNWIYLQEADITAGRMQIANNMSEALVADPTGTVWVGLEYFCQEGDELWRRSDEEIKTLGINELDAIGLIEKGDVIDGTVVRIPKAYPAYFGTYERWEELRQWLDQFNNLWLLGRNGMHRYNNQDHSMLTAMKAVELIAHGRTDKAAVWRINTEQDYHEDRRDT